MNKGLNHFYHLVWSHTLNVWLAVGELAKGRGKKQSIKARQCGPSQTVKNSRGFGGPKSLLALSVSLSLVTPILQAAPLNGIVQQGQGSIQQQGLVTTVNQQSQQLNVDWQSFNVAANETVHFAQPNVSAVAINHILDTNGSKIHGQIQANGQVWLINPNGVLFSQSAQVNVGALLASTLQEQNANSANVTFSKRQNSLGEVKNHGSIEAGNGGYIAFLGETVENQGRLTAEGGTVALAAGSNINVQFAGQQLLSLNVAASTLDNLASNQGLIQALGGQVLMSAGARDSLLASVVNNDGVIEAQSISKQGSNIVLLSGLAAGTTTVAGTLDASADENHRGADGGFIETSGLHVNVNQAAVITTYAEQGETGTWLIDPNDYTIAASGGEETGAALGARLADNNITIQTNSAGSEPGDITVDDSITWTSGNTLTLEAQANITINQTVDASGGAGGKLILKYGQASSDGGDGDYDIHAPVNLQAGTNYSTQLGSNTSNLINYQVITELGEQGSETGEDLQGMNGNLSRHYALGSDIDAADTEGWNDDAGFQPIAGANNNVFSGNFDGLGHVIDKLAINRPDKHFVALIGRYENGRVGNLGLFNTIIQGANFVASLIGYSTSATVKNTNVAGTVEGIDNVGGLLGMSYLSNTYFNHSTTTVTGLGGNSVGGLVGTNHSGTISRSYASGTVTSSGSSVGGLVGHNYSAQRDSSINDSNATGDVVGINYVGGLVGSTREHSNGSSNSILSSYATGAVIGNLFVGGLTGLIDARSGIIRISSSYTTSSVNGNSSVGGLIGGSVADHGTVIINSSFATGVVDATGGSAGGLVGSILTISGSNRINNSYSASPVNGTDITGGFVGYINLVSGNNLIDNSYASGSVTGSGLLGGLIGKNDGSNINNSYWDTTTNGLTISDGGEGKTTIQLQQFTTFNDSNWSISDTSGANTTWRIYEGNSYPLLRKLLTPKNVSSEVEYDGQAHSYTLPTDPLIFKAADYVADTTEHINVGRYTVADASKLYSTQLGYDIIGAELVIVPKAISLMGSRTYNGEADVNVSALTLNNANPVNGETVVLNDGGASSITLIGSNAGDAGNYNNTQIDLGPLSLRLQDGAVASNYTLEGADHSVTITPKTITLIASREYNGNGNFSSSELSAANDDLVGDTVLFEIISGNGVTTESDAGNGYQLLTSALTLSDGNYSFASNGHIANISQKKIALLGSRTYNGEADVIVNDLTLNNASPVSDEVVILNDSGTGGITLTGVNAGDAGSYNNSEVNLNDLSLLLDDGRIANNYTLAGGDHAVTISAKAITLSGNREYNGNGNFSINELTAANGNLVGTTELVDVIGGNASTVESDAGNNYQLQTSALTLSDSNYRLADNGHSASISQKKIALLGNRTYNGNAEIAFDQLTLVNSSPVNGDVLVLNNDGSGAITLTGTNAGDAGAYGNTQISLSELSLGLESGAAASNYSLDGGNHAVTILARKVELSGGDRQYNGSTQFNLADLTPTNLVDGERLSGTFDVSHQDVGLYDLSNGDLNDSNYSLDGVQSVNIVARELALSGSREYNGSGNFTSRDLNLVTGIAGETLMVTAGVATTSGADANNDYQLDYSGIAFVTGANASAETKVSNYVLSDDASQHKVDIAAKQLSLGGRREYDGSNNFGHNNLHLDTGIEGEVLSLTAGSGTVSGADAQNNYNLEHTGVTFVAAENSSPETNASNYTLVGDNSDHRVDIVAKQLLISGQREYDASTNFSYGDLQLDTGIVGEQLTLTAGSGTVIGSDVGNDYQLSHTGVTYLGAADAIQLTKASNYVINPDESQHQVDISIKQLSLSGRREYNGSAIFNNNDLQLDTGINGETLALTSGSGTVSSADAKQGYVIDYNGLVVELGANASGATKLSNYAVASDATVHRVDIAAKQLTLNGRREYNASAVFDSNDLSLDTGISDETLTIKAGSATVAGINRGDDYQLDHSDISFEAAANASLSTKASNYVLSNEPSDHKASIVAKQLFLTGRREYDSSTNFTNSDLVLDTGISGETLTLVAGSGTVASADVQDNYQLSHSEIDFVIGDDANEDTQLSNYALSSDVTKHTVDIAAKQIILKGVRVYDGSNQFSAGSLTTATGIEGETLIVSAGLATVASINADANYQLNHSDIEFTPGNTDTKVSNYTLADDAALHIADINPRTVSLGGGREYNGSNVVNLNTLSISNIVQGENLAGQINLANPDVGAFDVSAINLGNSNYRLADSGNVIRVTPRSLNVSGSRVYDGNSNFVFADLTIDNLVEGQTLTGTLNTTSSNADTYTTVGFDTGNANYQISSGSIIINARPVTVSGSREYDGSSTFDLAALSTNNLVAGETLNGSFTVADNAAGLYTVETFELDNSNYALADNFSVAITARSLSINGRREYDGTALIDLSTLAITNLVEGDVLSGSLVVASSNVGRYELGNLELGNSNYQLQGSSNTVDIVAKSISLSGSKIYDGNTVIGLDNLIVSGSVTGEIIALTGSANLAAKDVGDQQILTLGLGLSSDNYTFNGGTQLVTIDPKLIAVQVTADDRSFNGLSNADISFIGSDEFISGDTVAVNFSSALFASPTQANDIEVAVSGLVLSGGDANNYQLADTTVLTTASITTPSVSANTAETVAGELNQSTSEPAQTQVASAFNSDPVGNGVDRIDFANLGTAAGGGGGCDSNVASSGGANAAEQQWGKDTKTTIGNDVVNIGGCSGPGQ